MKTVELLKQRYRLTWPVEVRLTHENYEEMKTERNEHTLSLSTESEEIYMNELFARAKLAEVHDEPLLGTMQFEEEGEEGSVQRGRCQSFFNITMPIRTVWLYRVMREYMTQQRFEREMAFIGSLYSDGIRSNAPFMFFAYYILLSEQGKNVSPPPGYVEDDEVTAMFKVWIESLPSVEVMLNCYNYFAAQHEPEAVLTLERKIGFKQTYRAHSCPA